MLLSCFLERARVVHTDFRKGEKQQKNPQQAQCAHPFRPLTHYLTLASKTLRVGWRGNESDETQTHLPTRFSHPRADENVILYHASLLIISYADRMGGGGLHVDLGGDDLPHVGCENREMLLRER